MSAEITLTRALMGSQLHRAQERLTVSQGVLAEFRELAADETLPAARRRKARCGIEYAESRIAKDEAEIARLRAGGAR